MSKIKYSVGAGIIVVALIVSGILVSWQFEEEYTSLYRDGELIARHRWAVEAERTYINKNSWYRENVMCPKILDMGGYETATRCYYPPDYYEQLSRSLINTKLNAMNWTDYLLVKRETPFYRYGTSGAYAGILEEGMRFIDTSDLELFPELYHISWGPRDTRNYKLVWRVWNLKEISLPDGNYTDCVYNFGKVRIDLKDDCSKLERAEVINGKKRVWFYFKPVRDDQKLDISLTDPPEPPKITHLIGTYCDSFFNSASKVMTDTSCLQFKTETNGVITINDERYLAFALKGTVGGINYTYTSMDFSWNWYMNESNGDYIFWAENDNPDFIWRQYYYFYKDPAKPMKIQHYLKNNWADITNARMYYLTNVLPEDSIEYNETAYLVADYVPFYIQGNLTDIVSAINFNAEYDFLFGDLVENGFDIVEFYIGSGSVIGKPNINITAIGFTKNNGNFPEGSSVWIDPTFSTNDVEAIDIAPLDDDEFVIAWCDETEDDITFAIYYTNETTKVSATDADSSISTCFYNYQTSVSALNDTAFVIAYGDQEDDDASFVVYDSDGSVITSETDVGTSEGDLGSVSVSAFNNTDFVIAWVNRSSGNVTFATYDFKGNVIISPVEVRAVGTGITRHVSVSTFNSTQFVMGFTLANADLEFAVYDIEGNEITAPTTVETFIRFSYVVTFNDTAFVIIYVRTVDDLKFEIYDYLGNNIIGATVVDGSTGTGDTQLKVSPINSTAFVLVWHDDIDEIAEYAIYNTKGNIVSSPTTVGISTVSPPISIAVGSREVASDINLSNDQFVVAWQSATDKAEWKLYPDTTPPDITFITPTEDNDTNLTQDNYFVNVSINEAASIVYLELTNTSGTINYSMTNEAGNWWNFNTSHTNNMTYFFVYANDISGNLNRSLERFVNISVTPPPPNATPLVFLYNVTGSTEDITPGIDFNYTDDDLYATCHTLYNGTAYGVNATTQNATRTTISSNTSLTVGQDYNVTVICSDGANQGTSPSITLSITAPPDTCTPTAGQNWDITISDNCTKSDGSETVGNVTITGDDGVLIFDNYNLTYENWWPSCSNCHIYKYNSKLSQAR